jgi:hypothetical protein
MSEHALFNGVQVKIGTCEDMYYLRWEDRHAVKPCPNNLNPATTTGLRFRLPFPDEDHITPGSYTDFGRGLLLDWEGSPDMADNPGTMQIHHQPSGILLNLPCHHGIKLPELGPNVRAFWNGRGRALELSSVKNMPDGTVVPVVRCLWCHEGWRMTWDAIWDSIPAGPLKDRLERHRCGSEVGA